MTEEDIDHLRNTLPQEKVEDMDEILEVVEDIEQGLNKLKKLTEKMEED